MDIQRCCLFDRVSVKISKFKLKQIYTYNQKYFHEFQESVDIRPESQSLL
jgi:hypothetical protein